MAEPTDEPDWATSANYTTGPHTGTPTKVEPDAARIAEGNIAEEPPEAREFNWWQNVIGQWINWFRAILKSGTDADPNGIHSGQVGKLYQSQAGTGGLWINIDGATAWTLISGDPSPLTFKHSTAGATPSDGYWSFIGDQTPATADTIRVDDQNTLGTNVENLVRALEDGGVLRVRNATGTVVHRWRVTTTNASGYTDFTLTEYLGGSGSFTNDMVTLLDPDDGSGSAGGIVSFSGLDGHAVTQPTPGVFVSRRSKNTIDLTPSSDIDDLATAASTDTVRVAPTTSGVNFKTRVAPDTDDWSESAYFNASETESFTIPHDTGTTEANRHWCPGLVDFVIKPGGSVKVRYDYTLARWTVREPGADSVAIESVAGMGALGRMYRTSFGGTNGAESSVTKSSEVHFVFVPGYNEWLRIYLDDFQGSADSGVFRGQIAVARFEAREGGETGGAPSPTQPTGGWLGISTTGLSTPGANARGPLLTEVIPNGTGFRVVLVFSCSTGTGRATKCLYSDDCGKTWSTSDFSDSSDEGPTCLRWTGANLVAGFADGQIVYSDDLAETWTDATEPSSDYWAMASSDGAGTVLLVSTGAAALSSDHGETWTGLTIASFTPRDVAYFDGKFHVWTDANTVYQSEDGASWVGPSNMTFSVPIAGDWDPELLDNVGRCVVVCGQILVGFFAKWTDTSKSQDLFFSRDGIAWTRSGSFRTSYLARLTGATSEYGHHPQRCRLLTSSPQTPAHPSAPWHQLVVVPSAPTFGLPSSYGFADAYMSERDYGGYQQTKTVINASSGATMLVETIADENITLSGLSQTLNGVDVDTDGYYVLAIAQSDPTENGPWIAHSGVWTRPEELDVFTDKLVTVTRGNKFGDTVWICHSGTEVGVDASHWRKLAGKDVQDTVTLSADQTAWAPTGGSFIDWLKVNVAQPVDIHSLDIDANILGSGFTQKQTNVASTYSATFKHDSSSGTATKILCPGGVDFVLAPSETVFFAHDPTLTKIRILGKASEALSLQESTSFDFTLKSSLSGDAQCSIASGVFSWTPTTADAGNQGLAMLALTQRGSIARMERIGAATENMTLKLGPATNHATYLSAPILDALSAFNAGDVTALTLDSGSSVDTTSTQGGDISPDGYHVLDVDDTNNVIRQYYLSTPWKPSTRTLVYEYDTTGVDTGTPTCAKWGPTGERMYWGVAESNSIYQFDCGDTYYMPGGSDSGNSLDVSGEGSTPLDLVISSDESKIVVSLQSNDSVFRYDGTPELIGTFNYASDSLDLATLTGSSLSFHSMHWDSANSILYTTSSEGGSPSHVYRIVLAGVATLTGSTVITTSADLSSDDDRLTGMAVSPDEQYVVVFGRTNSAVLRYVTHALTADVSYRVGFLPQEHNVFESGVTSPVTEGSYTDEFTASWDISGRIPSNCVVKCTVHWCAGTASGAEADDAFDIVAEQTVLATFNGGALLQVQHLRAWASPVYNQAGGDWDDASIQYRVVAAGVFNNETADGVGALTADATGGVLNSYCETNGAGLVASAKLTIDHIMERPSELT